MKRLLNVLSGLSAGILGVLLLAGCSNQISPAPDVSGQGRVSIRIGNGEQARTLFPQPSFSHYELQFTPEEGQAARESEWVTDTNPSVTLAAGDWTITAIAYVSIDGVEEIPGGEYEAARGSKSLTVYTGQNNNVSIDIQGDIEDGQGVFSYNLSYPEDVDTAALKILSLSGETILEDRDLLTGGPSGSFALDAGYYILALELGRAGGTALKVEVIHIYKNMTTHAGGADYEFTGDDFLLVVEVDTDTDVSAGTLARYLTGGIFFNMVAVPGGIVFPAGIDDGGVAAVKAPYQIGETEVTWKLWNTVRTWAVSNGGYSFDTDTGQAGSDQSGGGDQQPVTMVSWYSTVVWCNALTEYWNEKTGASLATVYNYSDGAPIRSISDTGALDSVTPLADARGFRLPASNEWELAARWQGQTDRGNSVERDGCYYTRGNSASGAWADSTYTTATNEVAWNSGNASNTQAVKGKTANALGLYDMSGNVWEWCYGWHPSYTGSYRIVRGGSYWSGDYNDSMKIGYVGYEDQGPGSKYQNQGFRLARTGYRAGEIVPQVDAPIEIDFTGPEDEELDIYNYVVVDITQDPYYEPSWPVLQNNVWKDDSDPVKYYQFYARAGTSYSINWNDSYKGDGTKTADIRVYAYWKADDTAIFPSTNSGWDTARTFTADRSGIVVLKVEGFGPGGEEVGTFAIRYAADLSGDPLESIRKTDILYLSAPAGYTDYTWIVDNDFKGSGDSLTLPGSELGLGPHTLTLVLYKEGVPYSKDLSFTVEP